MRYLFQPENCMGILTNVKWLVTLSTVVAMRGKCFNIVWMNKIGSTSNKTLVGWLLKRCKLHTANGFSFCTIECVYRKYFRYSIGIAVKWLCWCSYTPGSSPWFMEMPVPMCMLSAIDMDAERKSVFNRNRQISTFHLKSCPNLHNHHIVRLQMPNVEYWM